jgi:hypothetical protein
MMLHHIERVFLHHRGTRMMLHHIETPMILHHRGRVMLLLLPVIAPWMSNSHAPAHHRLIGEQPP